MLITELLELYWTLHNTMNIIIIEIMCRRN